MPTPIWISHRGYCESATENTEEAFRAAQSLGFSHLETDLRATADGQVVLVHDANLARLTGRSLDVEQSDRETLERVCLPGGERLLFLDRFLMEFSHLRWIFDIKPESAQRTVDALLHWWYQPDYADFFRCRVRFLFWHQKHQEYLCQYQPEAMCMARIEQCRRAGIACLLGVPALARIEPGVSYALPPRIGRVNLMRKPILARYRQCGGKVLAYLPETEADTRLALDAGVDEILTNGPILDG